MCELAFEKHCIWGNINQIELFVALDLWLFISMIIYTHKQSF